ncbi:MAG: MBL fold metallo-hydrolase [Sphingomonadaceae bacterium]
MNIRILGSGTSSGVPRVGNDWGACDPGNPRNLRTRASILVRAGGRAILVDTSPDLRAQLLAARVAAVDAVIWTHDHADHCHGIDDLRQLFHARGRPVEAYARADTLASLKTRFAYAFEGKDGYPPLAAGHELPDAIGIGPVAVRVADQPHGTANSAGLRFDAAGKSCAYSTDFNDLTKEMADLFEGVDLWIVDCLRRRPHPTHPHLGLVLEWVERLEPARAVLTHLDQSMDYATLAAELPETIEPGYDGMEIDL